MNSFTVFPAIDVLDGEVVRLKKGERNRIIKYSKDIVATANRWIEIGASWLHVVNLNDAFGESDYVQRDEIENLILSVCSRVNLQVGGGIRTLEQMEQYFALGVQRLIVSTVAFHQPHLVLEAIQHWGAGRFVLAVDAHNNRVHTEGWQTDCKITPTELALRFKSSGLNTLVFTSIEQDGMGRGIATTLTKKLQDETGMQVIASGGANTLQDVIIARDAGLGGIILGRSIYEGRISLKEALIC